MHCDKTDQSSRKWFRPYPDKKMPPPTKENTRSTLEIFQVMKDCTDTNSITQNY